jgi:glycosyltransferase involved in cell wall biosynthesis
MNLTIITINFNNKEGLKATLLSVSPLKKLGFEYVVVDAQSSDGSVDIIKRNTSIIDKLHIGKDNGVFDGMNIGVKLASKRYIHFLNSGEILFDNISKVKLKRPIEYYAVRTFIQGKIFTNISMKGFPIHQGIIMERSILLTHPFDTRFKVFGDLDLWYRIGFKVDAIIPIEICEMHLEGLGVAPRFLKVRMRDKVRLFRKHRRVRDFMSILNLIFYYLYYMIFGEDNYYKWLMK